MLLHVLTNIMFVIYDILLQIQLKTLNCTSIFMLKCHQITNYTSILALFSTSEEHDLLTM